MASLSWRLATLAFAALAFVTVAFVALAFMTAAFLARAPEADRPVAEPAFAACCASGRRSAIGLPDAGAEAAGFAPCL